MKKIENIKLTAYNSHTITVPMDASDSFNYITQHLSEIYKSISTGHEYFETEDGGALQKGSTIHCAEHAANQSIVHEYKVCEFTPGVRIQYSSCPSYVKIKLPWKTIEATSNTHVWYDFEDTNKEQSIVRLTIGIEFLSWFELFFSRLTGGLKPWREHCIEEMNELQKLIVSHTLLNQG